jgi:hypothetical protein
MSSKNSAQASVDSDDADVNADADVNSDVNPASPRSWPAEARR